MTTSAILRRARTGAAVLALVFALVGCNASAQEEPPAPGSSATDGAGAEEGALPVTIEHKYGSTTIEEAPERIVTVGLKEQDDLLALGVVPVATTWWLDETPGGIYPWAADALGDADLPELLSSKEIEFEKISALEPDLIIGLYAGLTDDDYTTLSKIAPTIAQPGDVPDYGIGWQDELLTVGQAIGRSGDRPRPRRSWTRSRRRWTGLPPSTRSSPAEPLSSPPRSRGSTSTVPPIHAPDC